MELNAGQVVPIFITRPVHNEQQDDRMTRYAGFSNPLMLGFEELERVLERAAKTTNDGYPPYNIERIKSSSNANEDT